MDCESLWCDWIPSGYPLQIQYTYKDTRFEEKKRRHTIFRLRNVRTTFGCVSGLDLDLDACDIEQSQVAKRSGFNCSEELDCPGWIDRMDWDKEGYRITARFRRFEILQCIRYRYFLLFLWRVPWVAKNSRSSISSGKIAWDFGECLEFPNTHLTGSFRPLTFEFTTSVGAFQQLPAWEFNNAGNSEAPRGAKLSTKQGTWKAKTFAFQTSIHKLWQDPEESNKINSRARVIAGVTHLFLRAWSYDKESQTTFQSLNSTRYIVQEQIPGRLCRIDTAFPNVRSCTKRSCFFGHERIRAVVLG